MSVIVQKYGGSSVADAGRIRAVAERVDAARRLGHDVVVVVSAMGETTDELMAMAYDLTTIPNALEHGRIVIVAGFQGVSTAYDVTTLGRGGSDTTAVALAVALGA